MKATLLVFFFFSLKNGHIVLLKLLHRVEKTGAGGVYTYPLPSDQR